jgi:hypothetical protein
MTSSGDAGDPELPVVRVSVRGVRVVVIGVVPVAW